MVYTGEKKTTVKYHGAKYTEGPDAARGLEAEFSHFVLLWDKAGLKK